MDGPLGHATTSTLSQGNKWYSRTEFRLNMKAELTLPGYLRKFLYILLASALEIRAKWQFAKGQIISHLFLVSSISSEKRTNTSRHSSKKNSFVHFLEEFEDTKNHFEINWPLFPDNI